jgi:hypothetical protein
MGNERVDASDLLARYVDLHNAAARKGEPLTAEDLFADDSAVEVEGRGITDLRRNAIVAAFRRHELVLWTIGADGDDVAMASYAWRDRPRLGGTIKVERNGERIGRLTLKPGYSALFAMLATSPREL